MLNQCSFIGNLGRDPETRYMNSGDAVVSFSIAINEKWKDRNGEQQESTEWVNVTAFRKLAEICERYLKKGQLVFVQGKMKTRKYKDRDGNDRYSTEIIADTMKMLGGSSEGRQESRPARRQSEPARQQDDFDGDDIPF